MLTGDPNLTAGAVATVPLLRIRSLACALPCEILLSLAVAV